MHAHRPWGGAVPNVRVAAILIVFHSMFCIPVSGSRTYDPTTAERHTAAKQDIRPAAGWRLPRPGAPPGSRRAPEPSGGVRRVRTV